MYLFYVYIKRKQASEVWTTEETWIKTYTNISYYRTKNWLRYQGQGHRKFSGEDGLPLTSI